MVWACDEEREETEAVRVVIRMNVKVRRETGKPKTRWSQDTIENDVRAAGVCVCV